MGKILKSDNRNEPQAAQLTQNPQQRFLTPFLLPGNSVRALGKSTIASASIPMTTLGTLHLGQNAIICLGRISIVSR
jgi:hypothetical protein